MDGTVAVDGLVIDAELFKTEGSRRQELHPLPERDRVYERRTRYFTGSWQGRPCFVKQYTGDAERARREFALCGAPPCPQIVRALFLAGDLIGFERIQGTRLTALAAVPDPRLFLDDFARAVHAICCVLRIAPEYDFHTNNVLVRDDGRSVFVDFDLKVFCDQDDRRRLFVHDSLRRAGVAGWRAWFLARLRPEALGRALLRRYARGTA